MRGVGEGQRTWDVTPEGVMTNATVGAVSQTTTGGIVHVTYKGGESEYIVGPNVPLLALMNTARRAEVAPGNRAFRLAAARRHVRVDGIAIECGMARGDPERFAALLAAHAQTAELG